MGDAGKVRGTTERQRQKLSLLIHEKEMEGAPDSWQPSGHSDVACWSLGFDSVKKN